MVLLVPLFAATPAVLLKDWRLGIAAAIALSTIVFFAVFYPAFFAGNPADEFSEGLSFAIFFLFGPAILIVIAARACRRASK